MPLFSAMNSEMITEGAAMQKRAASKAQPQTFFIPVTIQKQYRTCGVWYPAGMGADANNAE